MPGVNLIAGEDSADFEFVPLPTLLPCADAVGTNGTAVIDAQVRLGVPVFEGLEVSFEGALLRPEPIGGKAAVTVRKGCGVIGVNGVDDTIEPEPARP